MSLRTTGEYVSELKPLLPRRAFEPARSRLFWLPFHLTVIGFGWLAITSSVHWGFWPLLSLLIGGSFAGLVFLGHETLHGGVVRGRRLRHLVGWMTFLPFVVSPRLWVAWHNRVHHGNANRPGRDPDAFPTLKEHQENRAVRIATDWFGIGRGRLFGLVPVCFAFSVQSGHMLWCARERGYLTPRESRLAWLESGLGVGFWLGMLLWMGPVSFVFACLLPWLIANTIVMAYILTNHSLSPHTETNDPLANSLTVTVPPIIDFFTLRFGLHVEHHLFPWMSSRHAPLVRELLQARYPERYQSMPLSRALLQVHRSPRVYGEPTTLFDPASGRTWPTLGPSRRSSDPAGTDASGVVESSRGEARAPSQSGRNAA